MSYKRYTAQEMRDTLKCLYVNMVVGMRGLYCAVNSNEVIAMLRQAADTEEELAKVKARLEAVVKVAKEQFDIILHSPMCWDEDENESHSLEQLKEMDALEMVVATARGDTGKEKK